MTYRQSAFFDDPPIEAKPKRTRKPAAKEPKPSEIAAEKRRLAGQCLKIYQRLQQGPATNDELSAISRKYTSRISDIRQAGYPIDVLSRDYETGLTYYQLRETCSPST